MEAVNIDEIKPEITVAIRAKGSSIFYTCTVLSLSDHNRIVLSLPTYRDPGIDTNRKIELRILGGDEQGELFLFGGIVSELFVDSLEIRIISREDYNERRANFRVTCEIKVKYMEDQGPEEWYTTYSINMGPGGMKMYSSRFHKEGAVLIFQFLVPHGYASKNILVRGRVLKIKKVTDINYVNNPNLPKSQSYRKYVANIRFEGLSAIDYLNIIRFIYSNSKS
ncbi:MAG: hypothetical protein ACOY46_03385 [Bacillota bacterium]